MQRVIGEIAEIMCGSAEVAGNQLALRTMLSQTTQYLQHEADGPSTIAQKCSLPHPEPCHWTPEHSGIMLIWAGPKPQ